MNYPPTIKIGPISTSRTELTDILKAWIALSFVFAAVRFGFDFSIGFLGAMGACAVTAGIGFLFHELAHKLLAQKYGCFAEFRAYNSMLLIMIALSFIGFVIAAPGAVMISGQITRRENGLISAIGPWTNLILAVIFWGLSIAAPLRLWSYGFSINSWLAFFNLLPIFILDGKKVWDWNIGIWAVSIVVAAVLISL